MLGNIGTGEIFLIMLVILLVFGAKRIPEIARGLGKGIREFKEATREISSELRLDDDRALPRRSSPGRFASSGSPVHGGAMPRTATYPSQRPDAPSQPASQPAGAEDPDETPV